MEDFGAPMIAKATEKFMSDLAGGLIYPDGSNTDRGNEAALNGTWSGPFRVGLSLTGIDDQGRPIMYQAQGGIGAGLRLPEPFPLQPRYPNGEVIDPVSVLHHEFAHAFDPSADRSLEGEAYDVREWENQARIARGYQPREFYYRRDIDQSIDVRTNLVYDGVVRRDSVTGQVVDIQGRPVNSAR